MFDISCYSLHCSVLVNKQESLANAKVNARQHCVSLSCLCNRLTQRAKDTKIGILNDHFLV